MNHSDIDYASDERRLDASEVTLAFRAFGLSIGVMLSDLVQPAGLARAMPPGYVPITQGPLDHVFRVEWRERENSPIHMAGLHVFDGDEFRRIAATPAELLEHAESVIEHYVAEFTPDFIFAHAGVVTWKGVAIILPGTSHSGKSTLVRALVQAGATYFSDEYAVLDASGIVFPYLRHLSQREGPFGPAGRVDLDAHAPSPHEVRSGAPVALVALTWFDENADWRADVLSPGAAMMAMSEHIIAMRRRPADAFAVMSRIVERARVVQGARGDAFDAASRIITALDAGSATLVTQLR